MDRTATALKSFCEGEESWVDSWTVSAIGRGWSATMPGMAATQTIGVTDERLLWLDENLETIDRDDVEGVTKDVVDHQNAPMLVRGGAGALVLGALTTVVLLFVLSYPLSTALLPLGAGVLAFVGAIGFARARKKTGERLLQHRLQIDAGDSLVTVWAEEEAIEAIAAALDPEGSD